MQRITLLSCRSGSSLADKKLDIAFGVSCDNNSSKSVSLARLCMPQREMVWYNDCRIHVDRFSDCEIQIVPAVDGLVANGFLDRISNDLLYATLWLAAHAC